MSQDSTPIPALLGKNRNILKLKFIILRGPKQCAIFVTQSHINFLHLDKEGWLGSSYLCNWTMQDNHLIIVYHFNCSSAYHFWQILTNSDAKCWLCSFLTKWQYQWWLINCPLYPSYPRWRYAPPLYPYLRGRRGRKPENKRSNEMHGVVII